MVRSTAVLILVVLSQYVNSAETMKCEGVNLSDVKPKSDYLTNELMIPKIVGAAILGNMLRESSLQVDKLECPKNKSTKIRECRNGGVGLWQWTSSRRETFDKYFGLRGIDPKYGNSSDFESYKEGIRTNAGFRSQSRYLWSVEWSGKKIKRKLKSVSNVKDAVEYIAIEDIKSSRMLCKKYWGDIEKRGRYCKNDKITKNEALAGFESSIKRRVRAARCVYNNT